MRIITAIAILLSVEMFGQSSFTLDEAISYALEHSTDLKLTQIEVDNADAQITEFKSIGMPKVTGRANYTYYFARPVNPIPDFITPAVYNILVEEEVPGVEPFVGPPEINEFSFFTKHNLSANIDASVLLFDGSYLSGLKAARMFKELTRKSIDVKEEEIKAQVTKAYLNILIAQENQQMISKNVTTVKKSLTEAKAYYENGFMEQLDVSRLQLSHDNLETELDNIEQLILVSKDLLKFQMNYPLTETIELSEELGELIDLTILDNLDNEEQIDITQREEYNQIELGRSLNELNLERLKKGYLPSVSANATINESLQRNDLFDSAEAGWIPQAYVGLGVRVPIYDGNEKKAQIKQAKLELEKNEIQKSEFERAVNLQVRTTRMQLSNAKRNYYNRKDALDITEDIYNKTLIKFNEGVGSSIEVTQAETQLYQAQSAFINAIYDLIINKTELDIALGEL